MDIIRAIEQEQIKQDLPEFHWATTWMGSTIESRGQPRAYPGVPGRRHPPSGRVGSRDLHRAQDQLLHRRGAHLPRAFPKIEKIEVTRKGDVRRAKLYYLRNKVGKAAKIKEKAFR